MCLINSDVHDVKYGVRRGPEQPPALERSDEPGASSSARSTAKNSEVM